MVREIQAEIIDKATAQWRASWALLPFGARIRVRAALLLDEDIADAVLKE